ncbi:hypothetical protein BDN71DRAFT_1355695, partial [Pleurotus eryngii]
FPQGLACKLIPKYMGLYRVLCDFRNNMFQIDLPLHLVTCSVHPFFHASLLQIHVPNDDCLFLGQLFEHIASSTTSYAKEWNVKEILSHSNAGQQALLEILWYTDDKTWLPFHKINHLEALQRYFKSLGI